MNFLNLYSKLPNFIKFNKFILDLSLKTSKKIHNLNSKSNQNQLFELLFLNSEFKPRGTLKNIQLLYLELLKFIDNVCNKYDIDYWLTDGTLLGAARHGGFIPWDDDIDIAFIRKDYEKLIEVLPIEISKHDYFKEMCGISLLRENHVNYYKDFNSVYDFQDDEGLLDEEKFLFLQIAWLKPYIKIDCFPNDFVLEEKVAYFQKNYVSIKYKFNEEIRWGKKNFEEEIKIKNNAVGFSENKAEYVNRGLDGLHLNPALLFKSDKIFPLSKIKFEDIEFKCPNDVDYCLRVTYGNSYMHLPNQIVTHNMVNFLETQFKSKEEMNKKFKKDIEYLRKINDEFE